MTQTTTLSRRLAHVFGIHSLSDPSSGDNKNVPGQTTRAANIRRILYWCLVALAAALIVSLQPVFAANNIWDAFSNVMKDIYGKLLGISTIIAVTAATIALLVRLISRNQRAVDEATTWLNCFRTYGSRESINYTINLQSRYIKICL